VKHNGERYLRFRNVDPITVAPSPDDYLDIGKGSLVVLLHGSLANKRQWRSLIDRLVHRHRCIAFDLIGYGDAMQPTYKVRLSLEEEVYRVRTRLAELVSQGTRIHIVGHSYGGAVAIRLGLELAAQVRSLTLFEPGAFHLLPETHSAASTIRSVAECVSREVVNARKSAKGAGDVLAQKLWPATQMFVDFWNGSAFFEKFDFERQLSMSALLPTVALNLEAALNEQTKLPKLSSLYAPTCLIGGRLSPRCSHQLLREMEAVVPHSELHWVPCGHLAPITDPIRVNPLIENFIYRADSA
jgi:pimeloyl-ACP methyl ester carboxylesterase